MRIKIKSGIEKEIRRLESIRSKLGERTPEILEEYAHSLHENTKALSQGPVATAYSHTLYNTARPLMQTSLFYRSMRVVADFDHSIGKFTVTVENAAPYSVLIYGENKAHLRRVFEEAVRRAYPLHDLLSQELTRIYEHD